MPFRVPPGFRGFPRTLAWNGLWTGTALALMFLGGEAYLRLAKPFMSEVRPEVFLPEVGALLAPDTEVRFTNRLDFWTVSRTNSLGFLDREPPSPGRAAETCHIAFVGDSFVEAPQVPIPDKAPAPLEAMAREALPRLDITTSAFGRSDTGQVRQLPLYDCCARRFAPRLLVLVFHPNDLWDNHPALRRVVRPRDPRFPEFRLNESPDGALSLSGPAPPPSPPPPPPPPPPTALRSIGMEDNAGRGRPEGETPLLVRGLGIGKVAGDRAARKTG